MNLYNKQQEICKDIKNTAKALNLSKPSIITNPKNPDMLVEKDLLGLDLSDIADKNIIKQLSADLVVFNDYAFRYYTLQFIDCYFLSYKYLFLELFIPAYKKTDKLLTKDSHRFAQFESDEANIIINFFQYLQDEIEVLRKMFEKKDLDNTSEYHYLDLLDCEQNIQEILYFWKEHINLK
ncbi:MAG: hypothetical protein LBL13_00010 [Bacteroidales bacterium]|jgi:hypothetical protein|nr:hypothetical protein [Bacteroidales bacterium]